MSMLSAQCDELRDAARGQKAMGLFELAQMLNDAADTILELRGMVHRERAEADRLRELFDITYGYYVSGTLTPCDLCDRYDCEGNAPTICKADEYDPDGIVVEEIERRMRELEMEVSDD